MFWANVGEKEIMFVQMYERFSRRVGIQSFILSSELYFIIIFNWPNRVLRGIKSGL